MASKENSSDHSLVSVKESSGIRTIQIRRRVSSTVKSLFIFAATVAIIPLLAFSYKIINALFVRIDIGLAIVAFVFVSVAIQLALYIYSLLGKQIQNKSSEFLRSHFNSKLLVKTLIMGVK